MKMQAYHGNRVFLFLIFILLNIHLNSAAAYETGRIKGTVIDKRSRRPLPHCSIVVVGTYMGAISSPEGSFSIVGAPPAFYSIKAINLNYEIVELSQIEVKAGKITSISFEMELRIVH